MDRIRIVVFYLNREAIPAYDEQNKQRTHVHTRTKHFLAAAAAIHPSSARTMVAKLCAVGVHFVGIVPAAYG